MNLLRVDLSKEREVMEEEKELFERLEKEILEDELLFARVFGILEE